MPFVVDFSSIGSPFFSPYEELTTRGSLLPHWLQENKIYFITFRLADSICTEDRNLLLKIKGNFETAHPQPWSRETLVEYRKIISKKLEVLLDNGYGSCILKDPRVREIFLSSLFYYENKKYHILGYVIMPNHVHVLLAGEDKEDMIKAIGSVKHFTAKAFNKLFGKKGNVWKKGSYDTILRSKEHLIRCVNYIEKNPLNLETGTYSLGGPMIREELRTIP